MTTSAEDIHHVRLEILVRQFELFKIGLSAPMLFTNSRDFDVPATSYIPSLDTTPMVRPPKKVFSLS